MGKKKLRNKEKAKFLFPSKIEQSAFHEAGHAIMYLVLGLDFDFITIEPEKTDGLSYQRDGILYQSAAQIMFKEPQEMDRRQLVLTSVAGPVTENIRCRRRPELYDKPEFSGDYELAFYAAMKEHENKPDAAATYLSGLVDEAIEMLMSRKVAVVNLALAIMNKGTVKYEEAKEIFTTSPEA